MVARLSSWDDILLADALWEEEGGDLKHAPGLPDPALGCLPGNDDRDRHFILRAFPPLTEPLMFPILGPRSSSFPVE